MISDNGEDWNKAGVCFMYVSLRVCVLIECMCGDDREGIMVFGRHCVRYIPKKKRKHKTHTHNSTTTATAVTIEMVKRNNITVQCGRSLD